MVQTQQELTAQVRTVLGKKVRALRRQGLTPANIYGHGVASQAIQLPTPVLKAALRRAGRHAIINLRLEGEGAVRPVVVRQVQRHPITDEILHVDFYQVSFAEEMTVEVPLVLVGEPPAVRNLGGVLVQSLDRVVVRCLPGDIPAQLEVDLSQLEEMDAAIHVADLPLPPRVHLVSEPDLLVAKVAPPVVPEEVAEVEEVAEEVAAAEPQTGGEEEQEQ